MKRLVISLLSACALLAAPCVRAELPDPARFSVLLELGDVAQARKWFDEGLDPNFEGQLIGTGLMIGAWIGNIEMMQLFVERGADIQRTNRFGETALMLAAWKNRPEAMRWLLAHGAQPNREEHEWTALHYAAFAGHGSLVDELLARGADANARSTNGSTAVMMAAREGHPEIAARLMAAGANPALKNDFGDDAVAWAMRHGNYDIAKTFTSAANFAELARAAANWQRPQRSIAAPDKVEELLRMARLAEARGKRGEALTAYRRALAELKAQQAPKKAATAGGTAKAPQSVVIRAKRDEPDKQSLTFSYSGKEGAPSAPASEVDRLLDQARAAEVAGRRQDALRLFREASARIKENRQ